MSISNFQFPIFNYYTELHREDTELHELNYDKGAHTGAPLRNSQPSTPNPKQFPSFPPSFLFFSFLHTFFHFLISFFGCQPTLALCDEQIGIMQCALGAGKDF